MMLSAFLEQVTEPGRGIISPERMGEALHMGMSSLAHLARINRTTLARAPDSEKVQTGLGAIARIVGMAASLMGDDQAKAVVWFRHQPLPAFDLKTAEELVEAGHADAVIKHLEM